jgi:hypothetical protein
MNRRWLLGVSVLAFGSGGCWWDELTSGPNVTSSTRNGNVPPIESMPKAPNETATRVDALGKQILAANPDITSSLVAGDPDLMKAAKANPNLDLRPRVVAIGVNAVVLNHQGGRVLVVSDGLVKSCKNDSELAAAISTELAKMVVEAQAQAQAADREQFRPLPPYTDPVGPNVSFGNTPDQTPLAERAMWEKRNPPPAASAVPILPNQNALATAYMTKLSTGMTGISIDDLARVAPLVRMGEANRNYEASITPPRSNTRDEGLGIR